MLIRREFKWEEQKKGKPEIEIEAKDFGPISDGKITLKPLTIFIGPNNSGKSYAAMLIYSVFESMFEPHPLIGPLRIDLRGWIVSRRFVSDRTVKEFREIIENLTHLNGKALEVPEQLTVNLIHGILEEMFERRLGSIIKHAFACPLNDLIRIGKNSFSLRIRINSYDTYLTLQDEKLKLTVHPQLNFKVRLEVFDSHRPTIEVMEKEDKITIKISRLGLRGDKRFASLLILGKLFEVCVARTLRNALMPCYYLPAARSGILQGHKALAASIVKKVAFVGIEPLEIPKFSGVVSDFLSSIITLPAEVKGSLYALAQDFEKELVKGEIVVRTIEKYLYPEIKYNFQGSEIPLHRASSTVSELAPLILYLKYRVQPNSILIIEEPEAHLHPENQRILAKYLVRLVRSGVRILITTHSEYLLEQLNNFILLRRVPPKERSERYNYGENDYLDPSEVAAYIFRYDAESDGHKTEEVEITEDEGISEEEFLKIHKALYEETIKLRRDLSAEM
jgi:predicted ATPase